MGAGEREHPRVEKKAPTRSNLVAVPPPPPPGALDASAR